MLPPITGPGIPSPIPLALARVEQGAQPGSGETAAAGLRPETRERVDPPRTLPATARLPEDRRRETLYPPDPDPPTGPPPAFESTPLDRAREAAMRPAALSARPEPDDPEREETAPQDDDLRQKAEADIAEVRRIAEPEPERAVDVTL
jgi:hypothetical protein